MFIIFFRRLPGSLVIRSRLFLIIDGNGKTVSNAKAEKSYKVKFDEDEDNIRTVPAHLVFAPPGQ